MRERLLLGTGLGVSVLVLSSCGGGSSGGASGAFGLGLSLRQSPASFETIEYFRSGVLDQVNASSGYATGGTGAGMTVAVIDTGIDADHPELQAAVAPDSTDLFGRGALQDGGTHGTAVSGLIAARRNGSGMHGMAFDAELLVVRADEPGTCPAACTFDQNDLATATDYAVAKGADILNYSLGNAPGLAPNFEAALADAAAAGRVLVFAAGNTGSANPTYPGAFAGSSDARGRAIVVGSVDGSNEISDFSSRAGNARDFYLVAPGENVETTFDGGGTALFDGTSMTAPTVAGAAAAVWSAAPSLTAEQVVDLLLTTATDLGAAGTDPIYGRGLLDLDMALAPQGTILVATGDHVRDGGVAAIRGAISLPQSFAVGGMGGRIMVLDSYERPYSMELDALTSHERRSIDLAGWATAPLDAADSEPAGEQKIHLRAHADSAGSVEQLSFAGGTGSGTRIEFELGGGLRDTSLTPELAAGDLEQVSDGARLRLDTPLDGPWSIGFSLATSAIDLDGPVNGADRYSAAAQLSRSSDAGGQASLRIGLLREDGDLLGSSFGGAFPLASSTTTHMDLSWSRPLSPAWEVRADATLAMTSSEGDRSGIVRGVDSFVSSGMALGLEGSDIFADGDSLSFELAQPLRVEGASATFDVPVARDLEGNILRERRRVDLVGGGREIDLSADYSRPIGEQTALRIGAMISHEAGHDASRELDFSMLLGLAVRY